MDPRLEQMGTQAHLCSGPHCRVTLVMHTVVDIVNFKYACLCLTNFPTLFVLEYAGSTNRNGTIYDTYIILDMVPHEGPDIIPDMIDIANFCWHICHHMSQHTC